MDTKEVKNFYENQVGNSDQTYEYNRWEINTQARASYYATKSAIKTHVLPRLESDFAILEIGPGPGTWTKELLMVMDDCKYDVVDISEEMLKQAKQNLANDPRVTFIHSDILEFTPTKQYDFFFSSRFLEYVPDKDAVIKIINQSLKPGGTGYLVTKTPQYKRLFSRVVTSPVHQGQILDTDLVALLTSNGFLVRKVVNVTSVFPGLRSGFLDRILSYFCKYVPFPVCRIVSESYAVIFEKNN